MASRPEVEGHRSWVDASGQLRASELAHLAEYLSEFQLSVHFWPQKIWFFTYLSTQQHLEIFLKNILFSIFCGRVIRIPQDYCLPFSFVYSVHFCLLASSVNPPGRACGSVLAMSCLHKAILFLLETTVKFLGLTRAWDFYSLSLKKETLLLSQGIIEVHSKFISFPLLMACWLWDTGFESLPPPHSHFFLNIVSLFNFFY